MRVEDTSMIKIVVAVCAIFIMLACGRTVPDPLPSATETFEMSETSRDSESTVAPVTYAPPTSEYELILPTPPVTLIQPLFSSELTYETPLYGCEWQGIAGDVKDADGKSLAGYYVHIWGQTWDVIVRSGDSPLYGEGGWELFIADEPLASEEPIHVQLHTGESPYAPVSEEVLVNYESYCSSSLAVVNFTMNRD
jgi:hypothetical protein